MIEIDIKIVFAAIAMGMTIWAHVPYFIDTLKGINRPHIFTWIIWSILTLIAAFAQFSGNAGPGAWVTFLTGIVCLAITFVAFRNGEKDITKSDWIIFVAAIAAIPLWVITSDALLAVIVVTIIDLIAFVPTFRKSWKRPFEENSFMYGFNVPRHCLAIAAIDTYSYVTILYPAALLVMNGIMYGMLKMRRTILSPKA